MCISHLALQVVGDGTQYHHTGPKQIGHTFTDKLFVNENVAILSQRLILIQFTLKFVPQGPIDTKPSLVHAMTWSC